MKWFEKKKQTVVKSRFKKNLSSTFPFFLEKFLELRRVEVVSCYLEFTFKLLHSLYLEMYKLVKECTVNYLLTDTFATGELQTRGKSFLKFDRGYIAGVIGD